MEPSPRRNSSYARIQDLEFESVKEEIDAENRSDNSSSLEEEKNHQDLSFENKNSFLSKNEELQFN